MITLTDAPFDPGAAFTAFSRGRLASGAVVSFLGLARGEANQPAALELQAYSGFTEQAIGQFAAEAQSRFGLDDVAIVHRFGVIAPGEPIVLVMTAAPHRREAFEGCDYLMDYLKSRAPLWKKELGLTGAQWVEPTGRDLADIGRWD